MPKGNIYYDGVQQFLENGPELTFVDLLELKNFLPNVKKVEFGFPGADAFHLEPLARQIAMPGAKFAYHFSQNNGNLKNATIDAFYGDPKKAGQYLAMAGGSNTEKVGTLLAGVGATLGGSHDGKMVDTGCCGLNAGLVMEALAEKVSKTENSFGGLGLPPAEHVNGTRIGLNPIQGPYTKNEAIAARLEAIDTNLKTGRITLRLRQPTHGRSYNPIKPGSTPGLEPIGSNYTSNNPLPGLLDTIRNMRGGSSEVIDPKNSLIINLDDSKFSNQNSISSLLKLLSK